MFDMNGHIVCKGDVVRHSKFWCCGMYTGQKDDSGRYLFWLSVCETQIPWFDSSVEKVSDEEAMIWKLEQ